MKKLLILPVLMFALVNCYGQYFQTLTQDGQPFLIGTERIVTAIVDEVGNKTVLLYGEKLTKYVVDQTIGDVVTNGCGKFFLVTDSNTNKPVAINKSYVDAVYKLPSGKARIVLRDLQLGNPTRSIITVENYVALDPGILSCTDVEPGPQVLTRFENILQLSGGGGTVDVSDLLDNTDNQGIATFNYNPGSSLLSLQITPGPVFTTSLASLKDNWGTQVAVTDNTTIAGNGLIGDPIRNISTITIDDGIISQSIQPNGTLNVTDKYPIVAAVQPIGTTIDFSIDVTGATNGQVLVFNDLTGELEFQDQASPETITTLVDNMDDTFTYTSEDGTVTTVNTGGTETITTLVDNLNSTYTYTSEDGTPTTIIGGTGVTTADNGLYKNIATNTRWGGSLIENVIINQLGTWGVNFQAAPSFLVTSSGTGDRLQITTGTGAGVYGTSGNSFVTNANNLTVNGGTGKTYWKYGSTPIGIGSFLHVTNSSTAEVEYAPYTTPLNNIGSDGYVLLTNGFGNLVWFNLSDLTPSETVTTLVDNGDGSFTYTSEDGTVTTWTETTSTLIDNMDGSFTYTDETGTTTIIPSPAEGADDWGDGNFTFNGDIGAVQTIDESDNINFIGQNLIQTEGSSTNNLIVRINPAGASVDDVITFDGVTPVWGPVPGGSETITTLVDNANGSFTYTSEDGTITVWDESTSTMTDNLNGTYTYVDEDGTATLITTTAPGDNWGSDNFMVAADNGPTQTISANNTLTVNGVNLLQTTTVNVDNLEIGINTTGASADDVIQFDGVDVIWAPAGGGSDDWGTGTFNVAGDAGVNQTISQSNTLNIIGENLIETEGINTDNLEVRISTVGASTDDVITYDGANVIWAPAGGSGNTSVVTDVNANTSVRTIATHDDGTGLIENIEETVTTMTDNMNSTFTYVSEDGTATILPTGGADNWGAGTFSVIGDTGAAKIISQSDLMTIEGGVLIKTRTENVDKVIVDIDEAGASADDVITYNGSAVVWAPVPSETTTTLVDNADGSFTYTNEVGTPVTYTEILQAITGPCSFLSFSTAASGAITYSITVPDCVGATTGCLCYEVCNTGEKIVLVK